MAFIFGVFWFFFLLIALGVLFFVFWLIMLIDSINRKFKESSDKVIWVIINVFLGLLGSLIYYFVVYNKDKNKSIKWLWWALLILGILALIFFIVFIIGMSNQKVYAGS